MITDAELIELERLLWEKNVSDLKKGLVNPVVGLHNPNYIFLFNSISNQKYGIGGKLESGFRGCVLEGSSRSGKTWSGVDIIIWLCLFVEKKGCSIKIYRDTYAEIKETLYDDFKKRLDDFGLPNPFHTAQEIKSFKIGKSRISFLGCDKIGKSYGSGCDYAFFNEGIFIEHEIFDQVEMRCRKFWWMDYNPRETDHWIFDSVIPRPDVGYLRTTFKDNPFVTHQERNKILSYEPWLPGTYEIHNNSELFYNEEPITEKNQPPPHPENVANGTANEFDWKVFGLGLRGAMKGIIFDKIYWIEKSQFPVDGHIFGIDFGFTTDPCVVGRYTEDENNIWIWPLTYQPIETPEEIAAVLELNNVPYNAVIACDSSDKYTGENKGTVEMVLGLQNLGWANAFKISKTKSVMYWLTSMKKKRIHIVKNHLYPHIKKEQENYRMKEINGISINQPVDKYNHNFDMARYNHMAWNSNTELETEWS